MMCLYYQYQYCLGLVQQQQFWFGRVAYPFEFLDSCIGQMRQGVLQHWWDSKKTFPRSTTLHRDSWWRFDSSSFAACRSRRMMSSWLSELRIMTEKNYNESRFQSEFCSALKHRLTSKCRIFSLDVWGEKAEAWSSTTSFYHSSRRFGKITWTL